MDLGLTSTEFLFFLPFVVLLFYIFPGKIKKYYLLMINLLFYMSFGRECIFITLLEALIVWLSSNAMMKAGGVIKLRMAMEITGIILLLAGLLTFKLGHLMSDSIVAPLGLSFYTLQAISYIIDVYRGDASAERNYLSLLTYLSFFPTVTSGPIYRFGDFKKYYNGFYKLKADYYRITNGIIYMIYGYFLKLVIAERAAIPVNNMLTDFNRLEYSATILWIVAITYSVQIFADFAGYSAIVIGIAQIIGFIVPENFLAPYFSSSVKEFWNRWHISLSRWLRDYIYIPLGGNRKGKIRKYINIMITFIVSGLWHGAAPNFLIWGGIHGGYQVIGDMTQGIREKMLSHIGTDEESKIIKICNTFITFLLVTVAWIFFRNGVHTSIEYICGMITQFIYPIGIYKLGVDKLELALLGICCLVAFLIDLILYKKDIRIDEILNRQNPVIKGLVIIVFSLTILIFGVYGDQHDASYFVYRDF